MPEIGWTPGTCRIVLSKSDRVIALLNTATVRRPFAPRYAHTDALSATPVIGADVWEG